MANTPQNAPPARRGWTGSTKRTLENSAMLGAKWWAVDDTLSCIFQRTFETKFGTGYEFMLVKPQTLTVAVDDYGVSRKTGDGEQRIITRFAMPPLAGFDMAIQDLQHNGFPGLRWGDRCVIKCVELQRSLHDDQSDMPMFEISIDPR